MKQFYILSSKSVMLFIALLLSASVFAQTGQVSGKISDEKGSGIPGVSILLDGTNSGTTTDIDGNFTINTQEGKTVLKISAVGFQAQSVNVANRSTVSITLKEDVSQLQEVVVTGYQSIRKQDITGAVTVVDVADLKTVKAGSITQNLAGRAPGVTISTSGSPGDATTVRVRGISSFTSNDPLYIIDGVPVKDQYMNTIAPEDIESIQVLKDASTASIYGSRASNGVIVITTKQGKAGALQVNYSGSIGVSQAIKGYDKIMNLSSTDYAIAMKKKLGGDTPAFFQNPNALPDFIDQGGQSTAESAYDRLYNPITRTNKEGTNWWKEITRNNAKVTDHTINMSGGNDKSVFNISANYFRQEGVIQKTDFTRASLRANSSFQVSKKLKIGENMMYAANWGIGIGSMGGGNNEQGILGNLLKTTPVVPVYDIKGNPGGHLTAQTGNFTNPTQILKDNANNNNKYNRLLGNIYAEYAIIDGLTARTSWGADIGNGWSRRFSYPQPYRVEGNKTQNSFSENWNQTFTWTWTNTLNFNKKFGKHAVGGLLGQEAISGKNRYINGSLANYFTTDVNAWYINTAFGDPNSRGVSSGGSEARLFSYFGKVDYAFNDKYLVSATVRRDGSSKFLSDVRYGIFPAYSVGWRISQEPFMQDLSWLSDLKLRASYGEVGNQDIRNYNFADIYGGSVGSTFYDIRGANGGVATGYALVSRGNASTIWETAKTSNIGVDASFMNNALSFVLDVYKRNTDNLLFNPALPGTAGAASAPFINVGAMENKGFDFSSNYKKQINKDFGFTLGLNISSYKNKIVKIADNSDNFISAGGLDGRLDISAFYNKVGYSISSFRGFEVDGLITTEAEKSKQLAGAQIGGLKFRDLNGDGKIDNSDRTIIGSPHPKFTGGLSVGVNYKSFDLNAFFFGSYGNEIFNYTKMFGYFMNFNSNIFNYVLDVEGTGNNPKINGLDVASRASSTFYIENGSYLRLQNLQLGYNVPASLAKKLGVKSARVYLQSQNVFTLTGYKGVDPAVSNANIGGGDVTDSFTGFDGGNYPSNRITSVGVNISF